MFDRQELEKLLKAFYALTNVRVVVFDERGADTFSYPKELPDFCKLVRMDARGKQECLACDRNACTTAKKSRDAVIYGCHAGLTEVITQIKVNDVMVGYLLLGHIMNTPDRTAGWEKVQSCCEGYDVPMDALKEAYLKLPYTQDDILESAAHILQIAASYLYQSRIALLVPGSLVDRLNTYIGENLDGDLSSAALCEEFCISRTALYHIAVQNYGCGIAEHVSKLRIQKAIRLLVESDMSNSEIAHMIGIHDYNYFSKKFRQQTGFSPREYRKRFKKDTDEQIKAAGIHIY